MRQRKIQFVYIWSVLFLLWFSGVRAADSQLLEIKTERYPLELVLVGVVGGADEPFRVSSPTVGVSLQDGMVLVGETVKMPVTLEVYGASGTTAEALSEVHVVCAYCQIKVKSLPTRLVVQGQHLQVSGQDTPAITLQAHTVVLKEVSAVKELRVQAHVLDGAQALVTVKQLSVDVKSQCEMGGASFEVKTAHLVCGERLSLHPAKMQADELLLNAQRAAVQLKASTVSKLSLSVDRLLAWLYTDVRVGHWAGQVKQARVFTAQDQVEFKRDAGYDTRKFVFFEDPTPEMGKGVPVADAALAAKMETALPGTATGGPSKVGALRVGSGFYMKMNPQVSQGSADHLSDGQTKPQQSDPHASGLPREGVQ